MLVPTRCLYDHISSDRRDDRPVLLLRFRALVADIYCWWNSV